jgi:hypothetical protein
VAVLGTAAGPSLAVLHEAGVLSLGPAATLWPLVFIVAASLLGVLVARWVARRRSRLAALVIAVPNGLIFLLYGFLLAFFGLGGSR